MDQPVSVEIVSEDNPIPMSHSIAISSSPLPKTQLLILSCVIFSEPVSLTILYPFLYSMVKGFHLTPDEREVGFYAGFLAASFSLAQFVTSLPWGFLSDRIGRRPVILIGLLGNIITSVLFGLSKTYWWAILMRTLCGLLNGNIAIAKCVLGEITDTSNQGKAFSIFGFAYGVGSLIAPTLGGLLAEPAVKYPALFGDSAILKSYPYLLPCLVSSLVSVIGLVIGFFFFEETLRKDLHVQASTYGTIRQHDDEEIVSDERQPFLGGDSRSAQYPTAPPPAAFHTILGYCILAFTQIVFQEVYVFWCNADTHDGGLAWGTSEIGMSMALSGAVLLFVQIFVFPFVQRYYGNLRIFRYAMFAQVPMFAVTGLIGWSLPQGPIALWSWTMTHNTYRTACQVVAFTAIMVMVNNSATPRTLGLVNGAAQASAAFVRAIGPALAGVMWSFSLKSGHGFPLNYHFTFVVLAAVSLLGGLQSLLIPRETERKQDTLMHFE